MNIDIRGTARAKRRLHDELTAWLTTVDPSADVLTPGLKGLVTA